jgi:hypothetical protein
VRFVSHWPLGVPLLFLAVYLPTHRKPPLMRYRPVHRLHKRRATGRWELWLFGKWRRLPRGTRPAGGFRRLSAYIATKRWTGTRNATETSEGGCSLHGEPGGRMVGGVTRPTRALRSSFTGRGFSTARLVAGARRLVGRDRRSHADFVDRVRSYCS